MTTPYFRFQAVPEQALPALPVGQRLRLRREQLGWPLPEIAGRLRIRLGYLQAIEDGRSQDLPGGVYVIGFLRSYAKMLGLDAQDMARRFRQEGGGLEPPPDLKFPRPIPERGVPAGAAILTGVLLLALTYTGWYRLGGRERLPEQASALIAPGLVSHEVDRPRVAPPLPGLSMGTLPAAGLEAVPAVAPLRTSVHILATRWMQVRQEGGPAVYERILAPGESSPVPRGSGGLLLSMGSAGGITLDVDGTSTPLPGRPGMVRRALPLTPSAIRGGSLLEGGRAVAKLPVGNPTGQNPPFLAGSGREALPPGQNGGQPYPEH